MDDLKFIIGVDDRDLIRAQKEQRKFERNILTIEQAFRNQNITFSRYTSELNKQASALSKLGGSYKTANSEVRRYSSSIRKATDDQLRMAQAVNMAGKSTNRFGMYAQQVGYQVGDFFVQVQSGTSALVAFGQQGTQLAGLLPGVTGAVVGISLAIGTMLLRTLQQAQKAAKESADVFGNWEDALKSASKVTKELTKDIHMLKGGFEDLTEATYAQNVLKATEALQKAEDTLAKKTKGARAGSKALVDLRKAAVAEAEKAVEEAQKELDTYREQRKEKADLLEKDKKLQELAKKRNKNLAEFLRLQYKNARLVKEELEAAEARKEDNRLEAAKYYYAFEEQKSKEMEARNKRVAEIQEELRRKEFAGMQGRRGARGPSAIEIAEMGMGPQITDAQSKLEAQEKLNKKQDEYLATLSLTAQEQLVIQGLKDRELLVAEQFNEKYKVQLELEKLGLKHGSAKYERALENLNTQQESVLIAYDQLEAEKKLTEEKKKQGQLIDTIGNIIGDGFISMVEGTESVKDAFKSMAIAIIKELYQILVVQQMVNAAKAAFGIPVPNANGNVFSSGSIQPYADGGVVGSPTTFPMTGGRTGLMGEAGPEAIMPLKRGANGKLGVQMEGGATTTVVQNFNFSANGDDSVKRIIAQAAPKIAQMTKSEMINDRRRGGTMKATFG
jgi:hypothetical protein